MEAPAEGGEPGAGADFIICPDNTVHEALHYGDLQSHAPWLHIAEPVSREAHSRNFQRLAILGNPLRRNLRLVSRGQLVTGWRP